MWPAPQPAECELLERAAEIARAGAFECEPNPCVGALLLRAGRVLGEGAHRVWGGMHAEIDALSRIGAEERADTLVVTLEPCSSHGKTPPCTEAILAAGIARVVVGALDPDPRHGGAGLRQLAARGVEVVVDPEGEARLARDNALFIASLDRTRPHVFLKWAMTADGRVAVESGDSQWVTSEAARADVHRTRAHADAVLTGIGTVLRDDCRLTARGLGKPVRIVVDSRGRLPENARILREREGPVWVFVAEDLPARRQENLERAGAEVFRVRGNADSRGLDLNAVMEQVSSRGVKRLMVEAGPTLSGALFEARLVDQVRIYMAPRLIGGAASQGPLGGASPERMALARSLRDFECRPVGGGDWLLCGTVEESSS